MREALAALIGALALLGAWATDAHAQAAPRASVLLAFLPEPPVSSEGTADAGDAFEARLAGVPGMSVAILSATQGLYSSEQLALDITQGSRISSSAYEHERPPPISLVADGQGARVSGWRGVRRRAEDAPQLLSPGLLAAQLPGGGAYAGVTGADDTDASTAANRAGMVGAFSLGPASTLLARIRSLERHRRFVVSDLPAGAAGYADLRALNATRASDQLLIVLERPLSSSGGELLWAGIAGLTGRDSDELTSETTDERGLIAAVDLAPTILTHLRAGPIPADMRGLPVRSDGALDSSSLRALMARLRVIGGRRLRALGFLLCALALLLAGASFAGAPGRARALRVAALAVLWAPSAVLLPAALEPGAGVEYAIVVAVCLALAMISDALLSWPRAPLLPAVVAVCALVADALAGTQLLMRSLLGPDPALGARFYGFGNELKSGLAVLVFAAVASALYPSARGRPAAAAMATVTVLLAAVEGSARLGAGVGGVILVSTGGAIATVMLLPSAAGHARKLRARTILVILSPPAALVGLAALDLATAHGGGHYTGSILHARSVADLRDVIVRRYAAAWRELGNRAMPAASALAALAAGWGIAARARLLGGLGTDRAWLAALAGGLSAGIAGTLSEDSGPELLVVAVFTLGCLLGYLWGDPTRGSRRSPAATAEGDLERGSRGVSAIATVAAQDHLVL